MFVGPNPPDEAVITYYQKKRHIFGDLKIEVFDPAGQTVRHDSEQQAAGLESRDVVDAPEGAQGSAARRPRPSAPPSARAYCRAPTR